MSDKHSSIRDTTWKTFSAKLSPLNEILRINYLEVGKPVDDEVQKAVSVPAMEVIGELMMITDDVVWRISHE
jgi:hypothetical protein